MKRPPVKLPSGEQMHALMDAIVQAKFALRSVGSVLDTMIATEKDATAITLLRLARKDVDAALAPWNVE